MNQSFDVIIIGAGPAGTACALALRHQGWRVALVDKATFPRDKICGDAIPGQALKALKKLSPVFYEEIYQLPHKSAMCDSRLVSPNGAEVTVQWKLPTFNSPRLHFDQQLLALVKKHSDTHLIENCAVNDIQIDKQGAVIVTDNQGAIAGKLVIGCDGAHSVVARKLTNRTVDKAYHCAAVRAYYSHLSGLGERTTAFYFLKDYLAGYCWIFPVGGGVYNVGFGMLSEKVSAQKVDLKQVMQDLFQYHPQLAPQFVNAQQLSPVTGFGLPLGGRTLPIAGERFMLAGDAASLIDPLQGHGIDTAVQSGILAAEQALRCLADNDCSGEATQRYQRVVDQQIGRKLRRSYRLMRLLSSQPWLVNAGFSLARHPLVKKWLLKVVG